MKNTHVVEIRFFGGPMDGAVLPCGDINRLPTILTKTVPVNNIYNHVTKYELQCFQMPDMTTDYAYVMTSVKAVVRP